ncbi:dihydroxyacetone kinase subunit L [Rhizobiales bacterium]|uniref:dihydroxyacetone kinase subunit DhaL n=1 Tax=Hongsoonwoonella zoysiae TaxID=2821844 RepID=UPI00155FB5C8|nr:dihydroxyacetone kinase subunit DhaL [Hongsoonwoonella zoysiae]NRG19003.1 dihydroxyacetone kinase subunit L [Hongsoonwoonella zoysiae]
MTSDVLNARLIDLIGDRIEAHADELTELDQAIGDGDHGDNMRRGFRAVSAERDALANMTFGEALKKAGMTLVMKVGGASGPLYGSAFMAMGKSTEAMPESRAQAAQLLEAGIEAVKARGKSDVGAKTMLDVLVPVLKSIEAGADIADVRKAADEAVEATKPMLATKGRAAFLGERSVGHIDPGARSSALIVHAVCDALEEK